MTKFDFNCSSFDGTNLYFQCWETDQNPKAVIALVHGLGEHSGRYDHWANMLNQAGYNVLANDLRGHGKSAGQRGHVSSFDDYLKDVDLLLDEAGKRFQGMPVFLYGHSLGGIICVDYVLRRKPKLTGVVISALSIRTSLQEQKIKIILSKLLGSIIPKGSLSSGLVPATISRDSKVVERYVNDPLVHHEVTFGWGKSALETIDWINEHSQEWSLPVLFMHGEKDALGYAEGTREFASKINVDCTVKIWPGLFHEVHNEPEKGEVFKFLLGWLDGHLVKVTTL
jgi:alpha-beta hydrolase superfamily lysophospholipase